MPVLILLSLLSIGLIAGIALIIRHAFEEVNAMQAEIIAHEKRMLMLERVKPAPELETKPPLVLSRAEELAMDYLDEHEF